MDTNLSSGWYPDPQDPSRERFWDGNDWVDASRPLPKASPQVAAANDPSKPSLPYTRIVVALLVGLGVTLTAVLGFNVSRSSDSTSSGLCIQGEDWCIGDTGPGGGIVYITPSTPGNTTGNYYEVAPMETTASWWSWCDNISATTGAVGTTIGTGMSNTTIADKLCTSGAIQIAVDYVNNGKTDWFLPSKEELLQMYNHRGYLGGFTTNWYWSSTDANAYYPADSDADYGSQTNYFMPTHNRVLPVRAFS